MKAKIATMVDIKQEWLDEIRQHIPGIEFEIVRTDKVMKLRVTNGQTFGDFKDMRKIISAPTGYRYRVYVISDKTRKSLGLTSHFAAYDVHDKDGTLDFYMSIGDRTPVKTTQNGFKYNFARRFVHECLHGKEQEVGRVYLGTPPDRTHDWEADGKLGDLIKEHFTIKELYVKVGLLQQILELTKKLNFLRK
jgi:hypothetical protein